MSEIVGPIDPFLGPVVEIAIGPSFAAEDGLIRQGYPVPQETLYAVVSPAESTTLISEELCQRLNLRTLGLIRHYIPTLGLQSRPRFPILVRIPGLLERSVDAIAMKLPSPIQCILGRDFLSFTVFVYDHNRKVCTIKVPSDGVEL